MYKLLFLTCFFTLISFLSIGQCEDGEVEVEFIFDTDPWGYEIYWELLPGGNDCGDGTIASGGNDLQVGCLGGGNQDATGGNGYASNSTFTEGPFCLLDGETYTFAFIDDWGDGGIVLEIYQDGILTDFFVGSGTGNTWDFTMGESSILDYDFPCNAYESFVGEEEILITNIDGTVTSGEPSPDGGWCGQPGLWCASDPNISATTWVTFEATEAGSVHVSTCSANTDFDTQLALWKVGDCDDFSTYQLISTNDDTTIGGCDGGNGFASDMFATCLNPGEVYYIQCDGWGGQQGTYELRIVEDLDPPIALYANVLNIECAPPKGENGENSILVSLPGVDSDLEGVWSGPNDFSSNDEYIEFLEGGTYTYEVTSECDITYSGSWEIDAPPAQLTISTQIDYPDCTESADGSLEVTPVGGTEPYNYNWVDLTDFEFLGDQSIVEGLGVGEYQVTVNDDNGCNLVFAYNLTEEGVNFSLGNDTIICLDDAFNLIGPDDFDYQWQNGSTDQILLFDATDYGVGTHPVVLNYSNDVGCNESSAIVITVDICDYIEDISDMGFKVYPNPVENRVLYLPYNCNDCVAEVYDFKGKLIDSPIISNGEIAVNYPAGIYLFTITQNDVRRSFRIVMN